MKRSFTLGASSLLMMLSAAGSVHAQDDELESVSVIDPLDIPPDHDPLAHAWDRPDERGGFYLRGSIGLGYQSARLGEPAWKSSDAGQRAHGFATGFGVDLGGFLIPGVALHLNTHAGILWSGSLEQDFGLASNDGRDVRVAVFGLAPSATFFTPHDFFFKTAFGLGLGHVQYVGHHNTTNPGFYMNLGVGNDLYKGRNLSVGIQTEVIYMRLGDENAADEQRVVEWLIGMSVAYDSI